MSHLVVRRHVPGVGGHERLLGGHDRLLGGAAEGGAGEGSPRAGAAAASALSLSGSPRHPAGTDAAFHPDEVRNGGKKSAPVSLRELAFRPPPPPAVPRVPAASGAAGAAAGAQEQGRRKGEGADPDTRRADEQGAQGTGPASVSSSAADVGPEAAAADIQRHAQAMARAFHQRGAGTMDADVLVGREEEVEEIGSLLKLLATEHQQFVLVLEGDAGIGKSALLHSMVEMGRKISREQVQAQVESTSARGEPSANGDGEPPRAGSPTKPSSRFARERSYTPPLRVLTSKVMAIHKRTPLFAWREVIVDLVRGGDVKSEGKAPTQAARSQRRRSLGGSDAITAEDTHFLELLEARLSAMERRRDELAEGSAHRRRHSFIRSTHSSEDGLPRSKSAGRASWTAGEGTVPRPDSLPGQELRRTNSLVSSGLARAPFQHRHSAVRRTSVDSLASAGPSSESNISSPTTSSKSQTELLMTSRRSNTEYLQAASGDDNVHTIQAVLEYNARAAQARIKRREYRRGSDASETDELNGNGAFHRELLLSASRHGRLSKDADNELRLLELSHSSRPSGGANSNDCSSSSNLSNIAVIRAAAALYGGDGNRKSDIDSPHSAVQPPHERPAGCDSTWDDGIPVLRRGSLSGESKLDPYAASLADSSSPVRQRRLSTGAASSVWARSVASTADLGWQRRQRRRSLDSLHTDTSFFEMAEISREEAARMDGDMEAAIRRRGRVGSMNLSSVDGGSSGHAWMDKGSVWGSAMGSTAAGSTVYSAVGRRSVADAHASALSGAPLDQLLPLFNVFLDIDVPETPTTETMGPGQRLKGATELLAMILQDAARKQPLLVVFDDAQWLDSASTNIITSVMSKVQGGFGVVLGARLVHASNSRRAKVPSALRSLFSMQQTARLRIQPLSSEACVSLAEARLGARPPPEVANVIASSTGGNPFYVEELLMSLLQSGVLHTSEDGSLQVGLVGPVEDITVNEGRAMARVVKARVDALPEYAQFVLRLGSVVGSEFDEMLVMRLSPASSSMVLVRESLNLLVSLRLISRHGAPPSHRKEREADSASISNTFYRFDHSVVQSVAYRGISIEERKRLHLSLAVWYEMAAENVLHLLLPVLAHHWRRAGDRIKGLYYLDKAGRQSLHLHAHAEAANFFDEVVALAELSADETVATAAQRPWYGINGGASRVAAVAKARWLRHGATAHMACGDVGAAETRLLHALRLLRGRNDALVRDLESVSMPCGCTPSIARAMLGARLSWHCWAERRQRLLLATQAEKSTAHASAAIAASISDASYAGEHVTNLRGNLVSPNRVAPTTPSDVTVMAKPNASMRLGDMRHSSLPESTTQSPTGQRRGSILARAMDSLSFRGNVASPTEAKAPSRLRRASLALGRAATAKLAPAPSGARESSGGRRASLNLQQRPGQSQAKPLAAPKTIEVQQMSESLAVMHRLFQVRFLMLRPQAATRTALAAARTAIQARLAYDCWQSSINLSISSAYLKHAGLSRAWRDEVENYMSEFVSSVRDHAWSYLALAFVDITQGAWGVMRKRLEESALLAEKMHDHSLRGNALLTLGLGALLQADYIAAMDVFALAAEVIGGSGASLTATANRAVAFAGICQASLSADIMDSAVMALKEAKNCISEMVAAGGLSSNSSPMPSFMQGESMNDPLSSMQLRLSEEGGATDSSAQCLCLLSIAQIRTWACEAVLYYQLDNLELAHCCVVLSLDSLRALSHKLEGAAVLQIPIYTQLAEVAFALLYNAKMFQVTPAGVKLAEVRGQCVQLLAGWKRVTGYFPVALPRYTFYHGVLRAMDARNAAAAAGTFAQALRLAEAMQWPSETAFIRIASKAVMADLHEDLHEQQEEA